MNVIRCLYARTDAPLPEDVRQRLESSIPADEQGRIERYRYLSDRRARWWGMALVDLILTESGEGYSLGDFKRDRFNRPTVSDRLDFNLSHSGDYVVAVWGKGGRVGVDIEKVSSIRLDDVKGQFSSDEWARIQGATDPLRRFYREWTAKEAIVKGDGRGLTVPLVDVAVAENGGVIDGVPWTITRIAIDPAYEACVASEGAIIMVEDPRKIDYIRVQK